MLSSRNMSLAMLSWLASGLVVSLSPASAQFNPPRIIMPINAPDTGDLPDSLLGIKRYYIDKGLETSINRGDVLNVYREKRLSRRIARPLRMFIGTMTITESQLGSSIGKFDPNVATMDHPLIRYKAPMKGDIVVPRLVIDSGVLFDPGDAALKGGAAEEFDKVADFVNNFSPSKLIIEGHTDSDGDEDSNLLLSKNRAESVVKYLINEFDFITPAMVEARGYGEAQPVVPNDTPENKKLNRRIEVLVWE